MRRRKIKVIQIFSPLTMWLYTYDSEIHFLFLLPGLTVFESGHKKPEKRKKVKGGDAEEIDNFLGPWAKYLDEKSVAKPTEVLLSFKMCHEIQFKVVTAWPNNLTYTHHVLQRLSQEEKKELDEITAKRQKKGRNEEEAPAEEKTILHGTVNHCNPVVAWHSVISLSAAYDYEFFR